MAETESIVWTYHTWLIYASGDEHLGSFHFLVSMNNVVMNIRVPCFVWTYVCSSLVYIPSGGINGSYGNFFF